MPARALFLNGTVGVGKSTTAKRVGYHLVDRGVPHAVLDLDEIRQCWPAPSGDPFHLELQLRNLAALASSFWDAGASRLVLAGVCESGAERIRYAEAVGVPLTVCRLRARPDVLESRLRSRHAAPGAEDELAWHLERSPVLDAVLDTGGADDAEVAVDERTPDEVAGAVLAEVDW